MLEDEIYRTSSQFRYWSYTRESLASLRQDANDLASERVRAAIRRSRAGVHNGLKNSSGKPQGEKLEPTPIETLTVQEELRIVRWGCSKIVEMGAAMRPEIPLDIRATAVQYLRRFYLTNSPMTYHPKQIMMCALFLATKSDHWHIALHNFVSKLGDTVTEDDVKAPEFLLMQGLRFTLDVRHPMRGLEGGKGEILAMIDDGSLKLPENDRHNSMTRVATAAQRASDILLTEAQMTDAYFLYTPSQIWLAALQVADHDLVSVYISRKLEHFGAVGFPLQDKLLQTISTCAELLSSYKDDPAEAKEIKRIGKKLHLCQNPEKVDLVAVTRAKAAEKREGADGSDAEKALKKRKTERAQLDKDGDVFGSNLKAVTK